VTRSFAGSIAHQERARRTLPRGVATAFRAAQLPLPICFDHGRGSRIWDVDGNEYIDYALGFGPLLLGHSPEPVLEAVRRQLEIGLGYGASHVLEAELAEAVCRTVPSADMAVFASTGSEAVHAAMRMARAATGRMRIVKFLGHYDGWYDSVHVGVPPQREAGPGTLGQDPAAASSVSVLPWNDDAALEQALSEGDVAAVIMEPVNWNGGGIPPAPGYLERARELTRRYGSLLIFDEVITGYRLALGGAQQRFGVIPDLTVLGKALGGGFPISAVCGSEAAMEVVVDGRMAHVGTFNANPICAAAAVAAITTLEQGAGEIYPRLDAYARRLADAFATAGDAHGLPLSANVDVGTLCVFALPERPASYVDTLSADFAAYRELARSLLERGVHVIPRGLTYVSTEHDDRDIDETCVLIDEAVSATVERLAMAQAGAG
jgi:glutamate-1-semialdehyde 2,1-aminomutase